MIWLDNFSKTHPKTTVHVNELDYHQSLWTVAAYHKFNGDHAEVPWERVINRAGERVPLMPLELFDQKLFDYVCNRIEKVELDPLDTLSYTRDLRSAPVGPPDDLDDDEQDAVETQSKFFNRFIPKTMIPAKSRRMRT